ncbi:dipeptide ABC transporter ATP-binding protein [Rothia nasimurium]|uniref:dipeptide ABC transporter ATP-binding protein n=1 Tax=Rothia nasimurium TaxID=85336 RepID=UPI003B9ED36A
MTTLLTVKDLNVSYSTKKGTVQAVHGISLTVEPGQTTAIVGESGSGKSTTAMAIIGLLSRNATVSAGEISLRGETVTASMRGTRIGLIPQDPANSLNPTQTIGASISEGLRIHRLPASKERVLELLAQVGIDDPERRYHQYPHELSGGMNQRVLIAAALALEPDLLIADEPTSALDVTVQKVILDLIDTMRVQRGIGVLFITHDLAVAGDRAHRIVVMQNGQVVEEGLAATVLTNPAQPYTRRLLDDAPSLVTYVSVGQTGRQVIPWEEEKPSLLSVRDFGQNFGDFTAVKDVSFDVPQGSTHAIVGESGSGKTTLGRAIAGFATPSEGTLHLDGQPFVRGRAHHRKVQLVYQNPYSSLDPRQTIGAAIGEGLRNFTQLTPSQIRDKVNAYLELVALDPALASRRPRELSGGQRQRVAIARALILEPELVVLDEAVSALDVTVQAQILKLLSKLQEELGLTYIFISHDLAVVRQISDTVSVMSRGRQVEYGPTGQVFSSPQHPFTRTLIEAIPGESYRHGLLNTGL